jgi:glycosyltransferase involved in cell wall biosynthesis
MSQPRHVLLNAIANTGAGAFNVACQLQRHLAELRPDWTFTLALIDRLPLHDTVDAGSLPPNCPVFRAPPQTAKLLARVRWERRHWPTLVKSMRIDAVMQLNAMMVPGVDVPVFCHNQDPFPYRPEAWDPGVKWKIITALRRREHKKAFRKADFVGFTSHYLRSLMIERLGCRPKRDAVFYNGLPDAWIERARNALPGYDDRDDEIVSVSTVGPYKRQELIVRALPKLIRRPGCEKLRYRMLGLICTDDYGRHMRSLAEQLGVADRVIMEGRVPDERVEQVLARARVFCLMSVCESFGIPAIEAMSFGTPVVTSDCCAMPEVCRDAAILSPVDDVDALADNLYRVWSDRSLAETLRARGAANVQRFHWRHTATDMLKMLEEILAGSATRSSAARSSAPTSSPAPR